MKVLVYRCGKCSLERWRNYNILCTVEYLLCFLCLSGLFYHSGKPAVTKSSTLNIHIEILISKIMLFGSRNILCSSEQHVVYLLGVHDLRSHCRQVLRVCQRAHVLVGYRFCTGWRHCKRQISLTTCSLVYTLYGCFLKQ